MKRKFKPSSRCSLVSASASSSSSAARALSDRNLLTTIYSFLGPNQRKMHEVSQIWSCIPRLSLHVDFGVTSSVPMTSRLCNTKSIKLLLPNMAYNEARTIHNITSLSSVLPSNLTSVTIEDMHPLTPTLLTALGTLQKLTEISFCARNLDDPIPCCQDIKVFVSRHRKKLQALSMCRFALYNNLASVPLPNLEEITCCYEPDFTLSLLQNSKSLQKLSMDILPLHMNLTTGASFQSLIYGRDAALKYLLLEMKFGYILSLTEEYNMTQTLVTALTPPMGKSGHTVLNRIHIDMSTYHMHPKFGKALCEFQVDGGLKELSLNIYFSDAYIIGRLLQVHGETLTTLEVPNAVVELYDISKLHKMEVLSMTTKRPLHVFTALKTCKNLKSLRIKVHPSKYNRMFDKSDRFIEKYREFAREHPKCTITFSRPAFDPTFDPMFDPDSQALCSILSW